MKIYLEGELIPDISDINYILDFKSMSKGDYVYGNLYGDTILIELDRKIYDMFSGENILHFNKVTQHTYPF